MKSLYIELWPDDDNRWRGDTTGEKFAEHFKKWSTGVSAALKLDKLMFDIIMDIEEERARALLDVFRLVLRLTLSTLW